MTLSARPPRAPNEDFGPSLISITDASVRSRTPKALLKIHNAYSPRQRITPTARKCSGIRLPPQSSFICRSTSDHVQNFLQARKQPNSNREKDEAGASLSASRLVPERFASRARPHPPVSTIITTLPEVYTVSLCPAAYSQILGHVAASTLMVKNLRRTEKAWFPVS